MSSLLVPCGRDAQPPDPPCRWWDYCMPLCAMTEGFEEFLRERREHAERTRRLLVGLLGVVCVALAVSNVILALRLTGLRPPPAGQAPAPPAPLPSRVEGPRVERSEEHTSELQSPDHLVCRLLLEKKKKNILM